MATATREDARDDDGDERGTRAIRDGDGDDDARARERARGAATRDDDGGERVRRVPRGRERGGSRGDRLGVG
jgi:hypothetical protein